MHARVTHPVRVPAGRTTCTPHQISCTPKRQFHRTRIVKKMVMDGVFAEKAEDVNFFADKALNEFAANVLTIPPSSKRSTVFSKVFKQSPLYEQIQQMKNNPSMVKLEAMQAGMDLPVGEGVAFPVNPHKVNILETPQQFYSELQRGILNAQNRIVLSSLYLGTGEKGRQIVNSLMSVCEKRGPDFKVFILLDKLRATRKDSLESDADSSVSILSPLLKKFPEKVKIALYQTPMLSKTLEKLIPPRWNEVVGVHHIKAYIFDDNLMISGANLSETYFTNRQDRYMWFYEHSPLCEYYFNLISAVSCFSYQLREDGTVEMPADVIEPTESIIFFVEKAKEIMVEFHDVVTEPLVKLPASGGSFVPNSDTWVFPTVQIGVLDIKLDEHVVSRVFKNAPLGSHMYLTSPYLNFTQHYREILLNKTRSTVDVVTACPQANGFYTAKDFSRYIPQAYDYLERSLYKEIEKTQQRDRIHIYEYNRPDWSYHAKGIWLAMPGSPYPNVTVVGSANFGQRSSQRDIEAQLVMITTNATLKQNLNRECQNIVAHTTRVTEETFATPGRTVHPFARMAAKMFTDAL